MNPNPDGYIYVHILRCAEGSYYVGITRGSLERRVSQHNLGTFGGYTASRRPVVLVWQQDFQRLTDAIAAERQIKGWSRSKKEALIQGDFELLHLLSQQYAAHPELGIVRPSTRSPAARLLRMGPLELGRCEESTSS